jgi:hypothetical protein
MAKTILFSLLLAVGVIVFGGCGPVHVSGAVQVRSCWVDGVWYAHCPVGVYGPRVRYYHPRYCPPYCPPGYWHPPVRRYPPRYRPAPPPPPRHAPPPAIRRAPPVPAPPPHSHLPQHRRGRHQAHFRSLH